MSVSKQELDEAEQALRQLIQLIKRPQYWQSISEQAGVSLDRPAAAILGILAKSDQSSWRVQQLADKLGIEAPSITRTTQALECAGYIVKVQDLRDKRAVSLRPTAAGIQVSQAITKVQRKNIAAALQTWQPAERQTFITALTRFSTDLSKTI